MNELEHRVIGTASPSASRIPRTSGVRSKGMQITQASVLGKFDEFYTKLKRPLCLADLKQAFNVAEKREAVRSKKWRMFNILAGFFRAEFIRDELALISFSR